MLRRCRSPRTTVAGAIALLGASPATAAAAGIQTQQGFCDTPIISAGCDAVGAIKDAIVGAAGWTFSKIFEAIAGWVGDGAAWLVRKLAAFIGNSVAVDVADGTLVERYRLMGGLALFLALPFLIAAVIQAVIRQDAGQMLRSALGYLPLAMVVMVAGVELTKTAIELTDWMSAAAAGGAGGDVGVALAQLAGALGAGAIAGVPLFVFFLLAGVVAFAAFLVWAELLLRAAAIYACLLLLPLVLAACIWPATAHWCRRLVHTLAALILAKLVIVATLSLGVSLFAHGASDAGFNALLTGTVLLFLAAFSPFVLLRLIPVVEAAAIAHLEGRGRRGVGVVASGVGGVMMARSLMGGPAGTAGAGGQGLLQATNAARVTGLGGPMGLGAYVAAQAAGRLRAGRRRPGALPPPPPGPPGTPSGPSREASRGR
jgi:hypothetical protein